MADKLIYSRQMKKANGELVAVMANQIAAPGTRSRCRSNACSYGSWARSRRSTMRILQPLRLSVADYAALFGSQGQGSIYQELEEEH